MPRSELVAIKEQVVSPDKTVTVQDGGFRAMLVNPIDFKLHYNEQLKARGVQRQGLAGIEPSGSA